MARGYLGRPELTAERLVPDPFSGETGGRLYRTGDWARWLPSGEVEYLGRMDFQVKVRGFRVEPGEIEAALLGHPSVREVVVAAREDAPGEKRLVAYVVPEAGTELPPEELRGWLTGRLPEHMVPGAFVVLEALPLTANGKTDRRALPAPDAPAGNGYVAPRTPTEERLAAIWAEVLRVERVGAHDSFSALGGHSLLATRVITRVRDAFGVDVPLRAFFETPTLAAMAERVEGLAGAPGEAAPAIPRRATDGPVPLSFAQQRLWLLERMQPGGAAYNIPTGVGLRGGLDVGALRRALAAVVRRHESLRTVFLAEGGEPVQVVRPAGAFALPVVDLSGVEQEAKGRELLRLVLEEGGRPFDLERGPLLRSTLFRVEAEMHGLLFTVHHIVSDGWSTGVLVREVTELYAAFTEGREPSLPELPVQYPDYALWQREQFSGEALDAQLAFWRGKLAGAPPLLDLPTDSPRPPVPGECGEWLPFSLAPETVQRLHELARAEETTLFTVLLAGWQAILSRWSGQDDVLVGTPVAGRTGIELEPLVGFFVNTLVLRTDLSGDPTLRALIGRARETTLEAQAHQEVPFERLVEELAPERSLRHAPLFQVMLALQNHEQAELNLDGVEVEPFGSVGAPAAKFDMEFALAEGAEGLEGTIVFRADLWDPVTVVRILEGFRAVLEAMGADPERRLSDVEIVSPEERETLFLGWNGTARPYPLDRPVHALFADRVALAPDAVAVVLGDRALTYAELDARAEALAARLRALGVGPEARVGLLLERTPELLAGVLGVWKAGGAYVPLDPAYPAERTALVLADAAPRVVVTTEALQALLPEYAGAVVVLEALTPQPPLPMLGEGEQDGVPVGLVAPDGAPLPRPLPHEGGGEHYDASDSDALPQNWGSKGAAVASLSEPDRGVLSQDSGT
ncbi:MAG: AMP-binding protein, partial [Gemmatimonadetes bacterium]|nr:AMP-binding protein [Gemmatimonadota bacterium]